MERSTVQSCLAAPVFLSRKPYKISINPRFRLIAGFSHFSYFGRNRPGKRVPVDTKLAQRFAFCPLIQTVQPAAISLRATRAAADRVEAFERSIRASACELSTSQASENSSRLLKRPSQSTARPLRTKVTIGPEPGSPPGGCETGCSTPLLAPRHPRLPSLASTTSRRRIGNSVKS
jgi:hypothetical protein